MPWGNWTRVVPQNDAERRLMYRLMDRELDEIERRLKELGERQDAWAAANGTRIATEGLNAAPGENEIEEENTVVRKLVQDKQTMECYAVEMDDNQNVTAVSAPIPFHEIGLVLPSRYEVGEAGAAKMNARPLKVLTQHEISAMNRGYADRRTMPVVDGTRQDSTQPEAMPETVPSPNPPELGKPLGEALHDQADDMRQDSDPRKTANMTADEAAVMGADTAGSRALQEQTEANEGKGDQAPETGDPGVEARVAARAGRGSTGVIPGEGEGQNENENEIENDLNHQTEVGTAGDARDSEQYAPREGANMKPGADLRRASQLPGEQPNPQDDQDGRKTQDAENGGTAARQKAIEAGTGQQEKLTDSKGENEIDSKAKDKNETPAKGKTKAAAKK